MQSAQFIYLLVAFMLFSSFSVALNRFQVASTITTVEAQQANDAVSLSQMLFEEAWTLSYDEVTVPANQVAQGDLDFPEDFTAPKSLGPDSGEKYPNFDDVDDFNGLDYQLLYGADSLRVQGEVRYINIKLDTLVTYSAAYNKLVKFTITSPRSNMELTFEYIYSYLGSD